MFKYHVIDDEIVISGVNNQNVVSLEIPEFIDGLPVTGIGEQAFYSVLCVESLIIPKSVVNIDMDVFAYDSRLKFEAALQAYCIRYPAPAVIKNNRLYLKT
jgi:hypothetical protein